MVIPRKFHSIEIQKKNMRKAKHFGPKRTGACCSIYDRGLERELYHLHAVLKHKPETRSSKIKTYPLANIFTLKILIKKIIYCTSGLFRFCKMCLSVSLLAKYLVQPLFKY